MEHPIRKQIKTPLKIIKKYVVEKYSAKKQRL